MKSFKLFSVSMNSYSQNLLFGADYMSCKIYKSDVSGQDIETIVTGQYQIRRIRVDNVNHRIYWAAGDAGKIRSANFDGSDITYILSVYTEIAHIEIDSKNNRIYFTENYQGNIKSCNLDGSDLQMMQKFLSITEQDKLFLKLLPKRASL